MYDLKVVVARLRYIALRLLTPCKIYLHKIMDKPISDARAQVRATFARYNFASDPQTGAVNPDAIMAIFMAVILLVALVTWLWNTGLPNIIGATNNTTALVAAGATAEQLGWIALFGGLLILVILFAVMRFAFGMFGGGGGGGKVGGYVRRRRSRRRR